MVNFSWTLQSAVRWTETMLDLLATCIYWKEMDSKGNNLSMEGWRKICDTMNNLYGNNKMWKTKMTPQIGKNRLKRLKEEYNVFKMVFKSGDGKMIDCCMDEDAWEELVARYPKVAQYKDPADSFIFYKQMDDMFKGKFATGEDAVGIEELVAADDGDDISISSNHSSVAHVTHADEETLSISSAPTTLQRRTRSQTAANKLNNKRDPSLLPKYNTPRTKKKKEGGNASALKDISISLCRLLNSKTNNQQVSAAAATRDVVELAVKILDTLGIDDDGYVEAIDYLGKEKAARTFLAMSNKRCKLVLTRKCRATFSTTTTAEETNSSSTDTDNCPDAAVVDGVQEGNKEVVVADSSSI